MTITIREDKRRGGLQVDIFVRAPDGTIKRERRRSPASSESATLRWAQARELEMMRETLKPKPTVVERPAVPMLKDFWDPFIKGHVDANQQKPSGKESKEYAYRTFLEPLFGNTRLDDITTVEVARLKAHMREQGYGPSSVNNVLSCLSKLLKVAVDWDIIPVVPCKIPRLKRGSVSPPFYDFPVFEQLVAKAKRMDPRNHMLMLLGGDAGLRRGEIIALDEDLCDTNNKILRIEWSVWNGRRTPTKGMEWRAVPMTDRLCEAIKAMKRGDGGRLLRADKGSDGTSATTLRTWAREVQEAVGLRKASGDLHIFRHTFCSHLAMRGVPVQSIQKLAGHQHLVTTLRYMHLAPGETHRAIAMLNRGTGAELERPKKRAKTL